MVKKAENRGFNENMFIKFLEIIDLNPGITVTEIIKTGKERKTVYKHRDLALKIGNINEIIKDHEIGFILSDKGNSYLVLKKFEGVPK